ncbi:hypothetical protein BDB00DRAFT_868488 [Zychaea mexicana]|uniref:uncharacterized protein n=1 Tax=Zychaea mexicana TaxID=64656 RepID=UPI0022FE90A9|nr:uncharacterized protein BDB00DRAFT_868488 [Zychaea mexicana]KAI9497450.1 hypothetical protein BDB00DRAFT_868488 [Zychaea mexicana]
MCDNPVSDDAIMDISTDDNDVVHAAPAALPASTGSSSINTAAGSGSTEGAGINTGVQLSDLTKSFSQLQFAQRHQSNEDTFNDHEEQGSNENHSLKSYEHYHGKLLDYEEVVEYEEEDDDMGASSDVRIEQNESEECSSDDDDDANCNPYSRDSYSIVSPFDDYDDDYDDEEAMDYDDDEETDNVAAIVDEDDDQATVTHTLHHFQRAITSVKIAVKLVNHASARQRHVFNGDSSSYAITLHRSALLSNLPIEEVAEDRDLNEEEYIEGREWDDHGDERHA